MANYSGADYRKNKKAVNVIGLDFGNFNSYPSIIQDSNPDKPLSGNPVDLTPPDAQFAGIPSAFCYPAKNGGYLCGRAAVTGLAPERYRIRYLKRSLGQKLLSDGKPVVIDGREWTYDDAIREVVQSVMREANEQLRERGLETTNLVSLAYPAKYSCAQRQRLIDIVQGATLVGGKQLKVVGTVMEPAAGGLEYLASIQRRETTTVLVLDVGGGTTDVAEVTCYPEGKRDENGKLSYYDIHCVDGLENVGGREFDDVIYGLLRSKLELRLKRERGSLTAHLEEKLRQNAESVKKQLSNLEVDSAVLQVYVHALDDEIDLEVSRKEFEQHERTKTMLRSMMDLVRKMLNDNRLPEPEMIVLTGGSCRMPMIEKTLKKEFPAYKNRIHRYQPEKAISYGAARYGIPEPIEVDPVAYRAGTGANNKPVVKGDSHVTKRTAYDLGIRYYNGKDDNVGYIYCMIPERTPLPHTSEWSVGNLLHSADSVNKYLYEAENHNPKSNAPDRDYRCIQSVCVKFGAVMPEGTKSEARLVVDKDGVLTFEARKDASSKPFQVETQLENLTS